MKKILLLIAVAITGVMACTPVKKNITKESYFISESQKVFSELLTVEARKDYYSMTSLQKEESKTGFNNKLINFNDSVKILHNWIATVSNVNKISESIIEVELSHPLRPEQDIKTDSKVKYSGYAFIKNTDSDILYNAVKMLNTYDKVFLDAVIEKDNNGVIGYHAAGDFNFKIRILRISKDTLPEFSNSLINLIELDRVVTDVMKDEYKKIVPEGSFKEATSLATNKIDSLLNTMDANEADLRSKYFDHLVFRALK